MTRSIEDAERPDYTGAKPIARTSDPVTHDDLDLRYIGLVEPLLFSRLRRRQAVHAESRK
jgi:hypothetical protein